MTTTKPTLHEERLVLTAATAADLMTPNPISVQGIRASGKLRDS